MGMPKWKKGAKEFSVSVSYGKNIKVNMPRPLIEHFKTPKKITFVIEGKKVIVKA